MDRLHPLDESSVRLLLGRLRSRQPGVVPARGHAEHTGHCRDPELGLAPPVEPEDPFGPVSRANQGVAFARISRSSRSRRSSSRSAVVSPSARRPSSRSAWATQLRMDCAEGSNSQASWSGLRPDRTRSTICCRYSAGYRGLDLGIVGTSSSKDEVSTIHPACGGAALPGRGRRCRGRAPRRAGRAAPPPNSR